MTGHTYQEAMIIIRAIKRMCKDEDISLGIWEKEFISMVESREVRLNKKQSDSLSGILSSITKKGDVYVKVTV